jgi:protein-S-isoprenylcysteine O-methyltransferase Ste14
MPRERDRIYEFIFLLSLVLLTGNWFIGGVPLLALTLVVVWRLGREEAAMIEKFGDDYRAYMRRSGRFLPRLRRHA